MEDKTDVIEWLPCPHVPPQIALQEQMEQWHRLIIRAFLIKEMLGETETKRRPRSDFHLRKEE